MIVEETNGPEAAGRLEAEKGVLSDRQARREREILGDRRDPAPQGVMRRSGGHQVALDHDLPGVRQGEVGMRQPSLAPKGLPRSMMSQSVASSRSPTVLPISRRITFTVLLHRAVLACPGRVASGRSDRRHATRAVKRVPRVGLEAAPPLKLVSEAARAATARTRISQ